MPEGRGRTYLSRSSENISQRQQLVGYVHELIYGNLHPVRSRALRGAREEKKTMETDNCTPVHVYLRRSVPEPRGPQSRTPTNLLGRFVSVQIQGEDERRQRKKACSSKRRFEKGATSARICPRSWSNLDCLPQAEANAENNSERRRVEVGL